MVIMLSKESSIALIANHVGNILQLRWTQGFLVSIEFDNCYSIAHFYMVFGN